MKSICIFIIFIISGITASGLTNPDKKPPFVKYKNGKPFALEIAQETKDKQLLKFLSNIRERIKNENKSNFINSIKEKYNCSNLRNFKLGEKSMQEICLTEWKLNESEFLSKFGEALQAGGCYYLEDKNVYLVPATSNCWNSYETGPYGKLFLSLHHKTVNRDLIIYDKPNGNKIKEIPAYTIFSKESDGRVWILEGKLPIKKEYIGWDKISLTDGTIGYVHSQSLEIGRFPFQIILKKSNNSWEIEYISSPGEF